MYSLTNFEFIFLVSNYAYDYSLFLSEIATKLITYCLRSGSPLNFSKIKLLSRYALDDFLRMIEADTSLKAEK